MSAEGASLGVADGYHFRISVADEYLRAIGRAVYNFASLEWNIICIGRRLKAGFDTEQSASTAGQTARAFLKLRDEIPMLDAEFSSKLRELGETFGKLTSVRDDLLHAHPATDSTGQQVLHRWRVKGRTRIRTWSIPDILDAARRFEEASIKANALLHEGTL
ncbi:MAG: hypothetical protein ACYDCA_06580 [Candidatus Tyrphobacter sp.]